MIESHDHQSRLIIDTQKISVDQVITQILSHAKVNDLTVEDPPMEDIVKDIYNNL